MHPDVLQKLRAAQQRAQEQSDKQKELDQQARILAKASKSTEARLVNVTNAEAASKANVAGKAGVKSFVYQRARAEKKKAKSQISRAEKEFADNPKALERRLKFLEKEQEINRRKHEAARKSAAAELDHARKINVELAKKKAAENMNLRAQQQNLKDLKAQKEVVAETMKARQKDYDLSKKIISDRNSIQNKTPLGDMVRGKTQAWAMDDNGKTSRIKSAAGELGTRIVDTAANLPSSQINAQMAGLGGYSSFMGASGKQLGGFANSVVSGVGSAVGLDGVGKWFGQYLEDRVMFQTEAAINNTRYGYTDRRTAMLASRLDPKFSNKLNGMSPRLPGMTSGDTQQMIQSAEGFGIRASSSSDSTFMKYAALARVWGDVSGQMKDLIQTYDDQGKAVVELNKAFGFGRNAAKELGISVGQAAQQFTTAGKMARFAGVDAGVAHSLMGDMSNMGTAKDLRIMGIDSSQLGQHVGGLISAPKSMNMAMQYYFASNGGQDKSMTPLKAAFMANYGDPNAFKYDKVTGVANFGENKTSAFLLGLKNQQMSLIDKFGGGPDGLVMAQKAMEAMGVKKEQFDLLLKTNKDKINSTFAEKYEDITKDPVKYLKDIADYAALEEEISRTFAKEGPKQIGYAVTQAFNNFNLKNNGDLIEGIIRKLTGGGIIDTATGKARDAVNWTSEKVKGLFSSSDATGGGIIDTATGKARDLAVNWGETIIDTVAGKTRDVVNWTCGKVEGWFSSSDATIPTTAGISSLLKNPISKFDFESVNNVLKTNAKSGYKTIAETTSQFGKGSVAAAEQSYSKSASGYKAPGQATITKHGNQIEMIVNLPYQSLKDIIKDATRSDVTSR